MKLAHISAVCGSYENAARFYGNMLGMTAARDFSIDTELSRNIFGVACSCRILVFENPSCAIEVFIPEQEVTARNPFVHHCIQLADRHAFLMSCEEEGLRVNRVPKGDKELVFVEDFDGNLFELK